MNVEPDGPAAKAGINEGDIVIEHVWIGDLEKRFSAAAGTRASVEVVAGGDGVTLKDLCCCRDGDLKSGDR
jgi:S1-C subfamily serine protease